MVNTRSQYVDSFAASSNRMEQNSDNESENSFPEVLTRNQMNEFDNGDIINSGQNPNSSSVDQRFMEMNRQISDLTSIVMALTEKISSSTNECNGLNTVNNPNVTRSDSVNNVLFKRKTTLIVWRQQNKGKDSFEEILNDKVKYNPLCWVCFL